MKIEVSEFNKAFDMISKDWMLISAGDSSNYNIMTASWGGFGHIWGKNICWCVIRPQRHTKKFVDSNDYFNLIFFPSGEYKKELSICGSKSGKDIDKAKECNFTPIDGFEGTTTFKEAKYTITCKKLYHEQLSARGFADKLDLETWYPDNDLHIMYFGEIVNIEVN